MVERARSEKRMRYASQLQQLQQQQEEDDTQLVQDDNLLSDVTACSPVSCARFARSLSRPCPTFGPPPEQISNPSTSPVTSPRRHVAPTSPRIPFSSKRFLSESSLFQATVLRDAPRIASPGCRQARDYAEPRKIVLTQDLVPRQPGVQRSPRAKYIKWTLSPAS